MTAAPLTCRRLPGPGAMARSRVDDSLRESAMPAPDHQPDRPSTAGASWPHSVARIERLRELPLKYHVCSGFKRLHRQRPILPRRVHEIGERTLLSADEEADLFLRLNYLKFRADLLRRQLPHPLDGEKLPAAAPLMDEIEEHLLAANVVRDALVRAFLKLAISLLSPFLSRQHAFEELLSEAAMALLRAVEMFDPERGFRFSTYATPAVRRRLERFVNAAYKDRQWLICTAHLDTVPAPPRPAAAETRHRAAAVGSLEEMLSRLDAREQSIVRARFGLEPDRDPQSLQEVAVQVGVCRERVRQIEARALEKLRAMPEAAWLNL